MARYVGTTAECYCAICGGPFGGLSFSTTLQLGHAQAGEIMTNSYIRMHKLPTFYNVDIISREDTAWTKVIHILGINPPRAIQFGSMPIPQDATPTYFISGRGRWVRRRVDGYNIKLDPNEDEANLVVPPWLKYTCYYYEAGSPIAFPFHLPCYEILARVLCPGVDDPISSVNKEALYAAMEMSTYTTHSLSIRTGAEIRHEGC
ncbi:hypothetical protein GGR54DRAFT_581157 [Hypoxylon sp. NC1633]|nr:hypothetical protein GGR54DRAFT_581157 [Hypoxylon sp. NC1633]